MKLVNIFSNQKLIERKITDKKLDKRLKEGIKRKVIPGEQWFRKPENWYSITAYANPYKTPYKELKILLKNSKELKPILTKTLKIFYGIGIADSENAINEWDLQQQKYSELVVIDAINQFIEGSIQGLQNLVYEYPNSKIMFKGFNAIFEDLSRKDLIPSNRKFKQITHICLGNTIGNFEQEEIFGIFSKNMVKDDLLLLGFQLDRNVNRILSQYKKNLRFEKLILESIGNKIKNKNLVWKWNSKENQIEAWSNDILVFRSKKYNNSKFKKFISKYSLKILKEFIDGDVAIFLLKKT